MRRFLSGLLLAPLAGAAAAFIVAFLFALLAGIPRERTLDGAARVGLAIVLYAFAICFLYTLVAGGIAFAMKRRFSALTAIVVGLVLGALPFGILGWGRDTDQITANSFLIPGIALAASVATAWAFWRTALRPEAA